MKRILLPLREGVKMDTFFFASYRTVLVKKYLFRRSVRVTYFVIVLPTCTRTLPAWVVAGRQ